MYPHAASAASSMAWLARLANPDPLAGAILPGYPADDSDIISLPNQLPLGLWQGVRGFHGGDQVFGP